MLGGGRQALEMGGGAECSLHGTVTFDRRVALYAAAQGARTLGAALGAFELDLRYIDVAPKGRARVELRDPPTGPALHLEGWIGASELPLYTTRELVVVPDHVVIRRGARVAVIGPASGSAVHVVMNAPCEEDFETTVQPAATCDATTLSFETHRAPPDEGGAAKDGAATTSKEVRTKKMDIALHASPRGEAVLAIARADGDSRFSVLDHRDGFSHIRSDVGILVDGWVADSTIEDDNGNENCDPLLDSEEWCESSSYDPDGAGNATRTDGCAERAAWWRVRASHDAEVLDGPSDDAARVGHVDSGAALYVVEVRGGWGRIHPVTRANLFVARTLDTLDRASLWVPIIALEPAS
jgi:hypothetical protein